MWAFSSLLGTVVDPNPWDPYVFDPLGSGSFIILYTVRSPDPSVNKQKKYLHFYYL
jgi:hypothetical protein